MRRSVQNRPQDVLWISAAYSNFRHCYVRPKAINWAIRDSVWFCKNPFEKRERNTRSHQYVTEPNGPPLEVSEQWSASDGCCGLRFAMYAALTRHVRYVRFDDSKTSLSPTYTICAESLELRQLHLSIVASIVCQSSWICLSVTRFVPSALQEKNSSKYVQFISASNDDSIPRLDDYLR